MKQVMVAVAIAALAVSAAPLFAAEGGCSQEKTPFQIVADTLKPGEIKEKNRVRPVEKVAVFQSIANGISEGSQKAKGESLRTAK